MLCRLPEDTDDLLSGMNTWTDCHVTDWFYLAIQEATKYATEVPFRTMMLCYECMEVIKAMAEIGNPNSVTDAGVGALAARSGVIGAYLNVKINAAGLDDKEYVKDIVARAEKVVEMAKQMEADILRVVNEKIGL